MLPEAAIQRHLVRMRRICESFPEVETRSGQHHSFLVRNKKFANFFVDYRADDRVWIQCRAERGLNTTLAQSDPERFFLPPYMAHHGWIGVYLDRGHVDWNELEDLLAHAYKLAAPKNLVRDL